MEQFLLCVVKMHSHKREDFNQYDEYRLVTAKTLSEAKKKYLEWYNKRVAKWYHIKVSNIISANIS